MADSGAARGNAVTLRQLVRALSSADLLVSDRVFHNDIEIDHLTGDSRKISSGGMFVAVRGTQTDGHLFIDKAVDNGAIAIVYEATPEGPHRNSPGVAFVPVSDSERALGVLAASFSNDPSSLLQTVGVTGTNGKSTVAWLLHQALDLLGAPVGPSGLLGTIAYVTPRSTIEAVHTTPDPITVHGILRQVLDEGGKSCVMEVSSHALVQRRIEGVAFDVAVFTNLSQDHLDYHEGMQAYLEAKKILFDGLTKEATAVFNSDDPCGSAIVKDTVARKISFGMDSAADVQFDILENDLRGLKLELDGTTCQFRLVGRFNAYNLAAAYASLRALNIEATSALETLSQATAAPGRFEVVALTGGPTTIVDYAHTPDALANVLTTLDALRDEDQRIWCVFGCGGDRDTTKRPLMAAIAEAHADHVIVTDDNPRTESSDKIFADIRRGFKSRQGVTWIPDRAAAISKALAAATADDIVLIAGKGHETYQVQGTRRIDFDDRAVARAAWTHLTANPN